MWEEEHPPVGFRNGNENIIFFQFLALGIGSSWVLGAEHTMAITMLTALGALSLILYFNQAQQGLFESRRSARRFWLLLLPVLYAVAVFVAGLFFPVTASVDIGQEGVFKVLLEQPLLVPVSTLPVLGWPALALGSGMFIAAIGLLSFPKGTYLFWRLFWALALSAAALALFGWMTWLLGASRLYFFITPPQEEFFASFTSAQYWSVFALAWSVVLGALILQKKAQRDWPDFLADKGLLLIIAFVLLLGSAAFTGAPAHHCAAALVLGYFFVLIAIDQWQKRARFSSLLMWLAGLVLAVAGIGYLLAATFTDPATAAPLELPLAEQRELWQDAWELFLQRPLFGWGQGGFEAVHPFIQSADLGSVRYRSPQSDLLLLLCDHGVIGALVKFCVPFGIVIAFLRLKQHKDLSYCLLFGALLIALFAIVSGALQSPPILFTFYLLLVGAYMWSRLAETGKLPVAGRLIRPEPHLRNTRNSMRETIKVQPLAAKSAFVSSAPHSGKTAGSESPEATTHAKPGQNGNGGANGSAQGTGASGTGAAGVAYAADAQQQAAAEEEAVFQAIDADARFDFIVIGGGSAGYAAANMVQRSGQSVALIDSAQELGGLCILRGCMPSKTLIYSAEVLHLAQKAKLFGLDIPQAGVDMKTLHERKLRVIAEFADYRREQIESGRFSLYRQSAQFTGERTLKLADGTTLAGRKILIATGSKVSVPTIPGLAEVPFWTSDDVLDLDFVPESVIVLGGGIVACELAQFLRRIGSSVTQIQRSARILKEQSAQASAVIERAFRDEGIDLITDTRIERIEALPQGGYTVTFTHQGQSTSRTAKYIFNALGRTPNTGGLGLEAAGIRTLPSGHIATSPFQQTSNPHVYAAGDVAGPHEIVHVAILQAEVAARHALGQPTAPVDTSALTGIVFTDPQIARVGPAEEELQKRGIETVSADYPFDDHGKSILMEAKYGYVKTVVDKQDGIVLAAECVGKDASELIHSLAVAVSLRARAESLLGVHWYHPTLSEIWTYPLEDCVDALKEDASK